MSEPQPPDDHELEEFLAGRSEISRAYREEAGKLAAPVAFEARVLAQAAAPVTGMRRVQRWRAPLAMAASLVLVVGVLRLALEDPATRKQVFEAPTPGAVTASTEAVGEARQKATDVAQDQAVHGIEKDKRDAAGSRQPVMPEESRRRDAEPAAAPRPASPPQPEAAVADGRATSREAPREATTPAPAQAASTPPADNAADALSSRPSPGKTARKDANAAAPPPQEQGGVALADEHMSPISSALALKKERATGGWEAARYQGLRLGQATLDDVRRRWGAPALSNPERGAAPLPEAGLMQNQQFRDRVDARGPVQFRFNGGQSLTSVALSLRPELPLKTVEVQERLSGPSLLSAASDAPLCADDPSAAAPSAEPSAERSAKTDAPYPQHRVYPAQGIVLLLSAPDEVAEIDYFERCR